MNFGSIINFLLIAGVVQGFGFNLVTIFIRKKFNKTILFLNLIILFISLNNLQRWLIEKNHILDLFIIQQLYIPWYLFILPMFYAFTTHFLKVEKKVRGFIKLSVIIFITELIIRLCLISYVYYEVPENNPQIIKTYTLVEDVFNLIYSIFLLLNACVIIFRRHRLTEYILSFDDLNWIKWFIKLGSIVLFLWAVALTVNILTGNDDAYIFLRLGMSILLYWLGYQGFYRYNVVQDRILLRSTIETNQVLIGSGEIINNSSKEDGFFNEKHQSDFEKIRNHIVNNKLYLDPLLSMEILASDMGVSKSYFSKLINSYSNFNFSDFINSFRVEQAKKFLSNDDFSEYTIVAIGLECGFNSKSTFYSAFKKFTSETPTSFRANFN
ncbi:helix-turn-helix domain-containing protein [Seonamhaeicola maritimus]|uniref:AraC family transcriptional regulator n=1 Tax=Seonamhaeicola maritimus TaxID=2591822 RepID=A0A5C7GK11_9FLAO|nr:helix-turn-helix domain-containing protein [Seonamhaeicola maritimus]TXG38660.1 AraC family transcriptional regulator [Seonamhaeicola maritimus]